jgi:hypothetical protein
MDVVLEEVCAELPNGGDHESRKFIAKQLIECARSGKSTLGDFIYAARRALVRLKKKRRSAWGRTAQSLERPYKIRTARTTAAAKMNIMPIAVAVCCAS